MAQQHLNVGTTANDGTGDSLRVSQQKAESNFNELYARPDFTDAPSDGNLYGRKDATWEQITGSGTTPTLNEVVIQGNEIVNTAGNLKIVLDKENNGVVLYELVSGTWEERGRYTSTDFQIGNGTGNYYILGSEFTGLTISNGTDSVQLTSNSITKNGIEVVTEVPYTYTSGEVTFDYVVYLNQLRIKNTGGFLAVLQADNLTTNRSIQFQDINYTGVEDISNKATDLTSNDNEHYPTTQAVQTAINNATIGLLDYRGSYNASSNLFPTTGGSGIAGAVLKGDFWICSVAGTLGGINITAGDLIIALTDTPAQTSSNWDLIEHTLNYVPEDVANKSSSYTASSTTTYANTKALVDGLATKQNALGFNAEDSANKSTNVNTDQASNTKYPSVKSVYDWAIGLFSVKPSFIRLTSAYTGTSSTSLQKMFNVGSSTNGSYSASANTTFKFKVIASLSGLSATSGTISFGILGTANITNISYNSNTIKSASLGTSQQYGFSVATASVLTSGNTATTAKLIIEGIISVTTAGTIIPAFALSQTTTPVVDANSYFEIIPIGSNTITNSTDII